MNLTMGLTLDCSLHFVDGSALKWVDKVLVLNPHVHLIIHLTRFPYNEKKKNTCNGPSECCIKRNNNETFNLFKT